MALLSRRGFLRALGLARSSDLDAALARSVRDRARWAAAGGGVASGVPITTGQFDYEYVTALKGTKKWDTLEEMSNDPHVKGALRQNAFSLLTAEWDIQPASDDPRDVEIAEFVAANLLRKSGDKYGREYWAQTSWRQRLYEILGMLEHGYAMFHKSWRVAKGSGGTKVVLDRIQWLEPSSVDPLGWDLSDSDEFLGVYRTYTKPGSKYHYGGYVTDEYIDADSLALYPWELRGARFEGKPFIRAMYGPWYRKDFVTRMAVIWAQKVGAPVPLGHYPDNWTEDERSRFEEFVQSLRGTAPAEAYGMFRKTSDGQAADVAYAGSETGEVDRVRGLIDGENAEIAHAGGTKSQLLGETSTGSRSVGDVQSRIDLLTMQAIGQWICEIETHGAANFQGLIEDLVDRNFAGVQRHPKLVVSKVDPNEGTETIGMLIQASAAGLVPKHPDIMRQVTERLGYSLSDDVYEELAAEQEAAREALRQNMGADDGDEQDGDAQPAEDGEDDNAGEADGKRVDGFAGSTVSSKEEFRRRIADLLVPMEGAPSRGRFRRPNRLETDFVMLADVQETFRVGEQQVLRVLRGARADMTSTLRGWLTSGKVSTRNLESLRQAKYRGMKRADRALRPVLDEIGQKGIAHVGSEIERMRGR